MTKQVVKTPDYNTVGFEKSVTFILQEFIFNNFMTL